MQIQSKSTFLLYKIEIFEGNKTKASFQKDVDNIVGKDVTAYKRLLTLSQTSPGVYLSAVQVF